MQDNTTANVVITDLLGVKTLLEEAIDLGGGTGTVASSGELQDTTVRILEHHISKDYDGKDVLVVSYEFYNGFDEATSFMWGFEDKAFQNGIECDSTVIGCDDIDSQTQMNEIQPGVTYTVTVGYHITGNSDVQIEVQELLGSEKYLSETISLQ